MSTIKPFLNIPPGEFIKEELENRGWTQEDLADIFDMTPKSISQIVNGKQSITLDTAKMLSKAFGQSPRYWINLDTNYRLRTREETGKITDVEIKSLIYKYMPVKEMVKKNWIPPWNSVPVLVEEVNKYWEISSLNFDFLEKEAVSLHFRKSAAFRQFNIFYALTWFQKARTIVKEIKEETSFDKSKLLEICEKYHHFTAAENGIFDFISELNQAGVIFIVLSHLQKTYIDAASFCSNGRPVIVYTARYNRIDNFWFSMAHEISHILHDIKKEQDYFIDDMDRRPETDKEKRANDFAAKLLKHDRILEYFEHRRKYISEYRVLDCADQLELNPGIVAGALQYNQMLNPRNLNKLKQAVLEQIPSEYVYGH